MELLHSCFLLLVTCFIHIFDSPASPNTWNRPAEGKTRSSIRLPTHFYVLYPILYMFRYARTCERGSCAGTVWTGVGWPIGLLQGTQSLTTLLVSMIMKRPLSGGERLTDCRKTTQLRAELGLQQAPIDTLLLSPCSFRNLASCYSCIDRRPFHVLLFLHLSHFRVEMGAKDFTDKKMK